MWPFYRSISSTTKLRFGDGVVYRTWFETRNGVVIAVTEDSGIVSVATHRNFVAFKRAAKTDPDALCSVRLVPRRRIVGVEYRGEEMVKSAPPPLVDARVLAEVKALESAVGGTEELLDLLRSIRAGYGEKVG